jgi:transposase
MAGKDMIVMSTKELKRVPVIHNLIEGRVNQLDAANIIGLSTRQLRRIVKEVKEKGDIAITHGSRGKRSNAAKDSILKNKILALCKDTYNGFGPTLASEMMAERDKTHINHETLRLWLIEEGVEYKKRKAPKHRSWRPRKESAGQMLQMDGSHHKWFTGVDKEYVLMGYVDDARGRVFAHFYEYEGIMPAMDSFRRYIKQYGIPQSIYLDKHSTYKSTKKPSIENELNNQKNLTQFARALKELGVELIYANSAPAKGRVERSFQTHQDRLVKQMRLEGINNIEDANKFLHSYYIPKHNCKFAVQAKNKADLHRPVPKTINLDRIFCIKNKAALHNDFTVQYKNRFYQVTEAIRTKEVTVEESFTGIVSLYHNYKKLKAKIIAKRPQREKALRKPRKPRYIIPKEHYYRKFRFSKRKCA